MGTDVSPWFRRKWHWFVGIGYLASYVALDWASYVQPFGQFGITPWNPQTGLSFSLILLYGRRYLPLLFAAPFLADLIVRQLPMPLPVALLLAVVVGGGYSAATLALMGRKLRFQPDLPRLHDVWLLFLSGTISTALVACLYVAILASANLVSWSDFAVAALRLWVGDVIGILVVTPFCLLLAAGRTVRVTGETLAQFAIMCAALWSVFMEAPTPQLFRFYLLFLPVIWISLRAGLPGACAGLIVTQLAVMFAIEFLVPGRVNVTIYQEMMLVLTFTGLAAGGAVTEGQRVAYHLRLQQDAHARLARMGSINELSAAVAHEINQPLSAAATYTRLLAEELGAHDYSVTQARSSAEKANVQVQRAAAVVRRLRDLIQTGRAEQSVVEVSQLLNAALEIVGPELQRAGVSIACKVEGDLPRVSVDVLQIEQVLINLVRNASEAIEGAGRRDGLIAVRAVRSSHGNLEIVVADNGPGFDAERITHPFAPFHTTKHGGLGIGLNLCRSIVEMHGGLIWLANGAQGAEVHVTLPHCGLSMS